MNLISPQTWKLTHTRTHTHTNKQTNAKIRNIQNLKYQKWKSNYYRDCKIVVFGLTQLFMILCPSANIGIVIWMHKILLFKTLNKFTPHFDENVNLIYHLKKSSKVISRASLHIFNSNNFLCLYQFLLRFLKNVMFFLISYVLWIYICQCSFVRLICWC